MKVLKVEVGSDGLLVTQSAIQISGFESKMRSELKQATSIVVNVTEKGDKPIKGVDYFTQGDKDELIKNIQINADIAPIEIGDIENLF